MTDRGFQIEFERRLQLMDPNLVIKDKLSSDTIISFINEAIDKFYKTRYSGINFKAQGFEQTEKRIDDLRTLIRKRNYSNTQISKELKIHILLNYQMIMYYYLEILLVYSRVMNILTNVGKKTIQVHIQLSIQIRQNLQLKHQIDN